ncbi:Glycosyltransferase [Dissulfuribacter thermophilus]|uniref:Glycosyltransferase n=1 Tax=Dissulfuribacter thermophilus TaxID=1156395 RepID=A0A1B9F2W9_9BACT|nr:methyltransferase domain-containing protein [Dissulfuribacter thermophilus]OCC14270.1 Glycosyltransferase [Dissulfuribacter thermophilus]
MRDNIKALVAWIHERLRLNGYVIEVGAYQVEGQEGYADLRPYFNGLKYIGIDMRIGPGVDCIQDVHSLGLRDHVASYVLCLDTLEHVKDPIRAVKELERLVANPGVLVLSSVMDFPIHDHPSDYWRFTPQAFFEMVKGFEQKRVFFQGDPLKPHTVIAIGAKGVSLDLSWPEKLAGEQLNEHLEHKIEPKQFVTQPPIRHKYHYDIDLNGSDTTHSLLLKKVKPNTRVLEIGCATGYMTRILKENLGCETTAVEIDEAAASLARPYADKLIVADVESLAFEEVFPPKHYDYIIMADVLEHLKDPRSLLEKLSFCLKDDGRLLISIPNMAHGSLALELLDGKWDYRKIGLLDSSHLRFFTISNFLNMLEGTGLWAIRIDRIIVDPWNTELRTQWFSYPKEVTSYLEKVNPEFRTYQFVVEAMKMGPYGEKELFKSQYIALKNSLSAAQEKLDELHRENQKLFEEKARLEGNLQNLGHEVNELRAERERLLEQLRASEENLLHARFELSRIEGSLAWRMLHPYRRFIEFALPHDTKRRKIYQFATRAFAYALKEGPVGFWRKTRDYLQRRGNGGELSKISPPKLESKWYPLEFPSVENPKASIVIPVYNKSIYTFNCLKSLSTTKNRSSFEVIVVDDASTDDTPQMMQEMKGVTYIRSEKNQGFVGSCNVGAQKARGEKIVFLNNDTTVSDGWLDALLDTFPRFKNVGLVGAKLVYPDGRLQEAGGIIFNDGSGMNFGKWDDPSLPQYNYVREVDYCSGAAICVPKKLFFEIGGFDTRYSPAYYEDTDLAMEVRRRGYRVLYQPHSVVIHHEGVTAGRDTSSGVKRYQEINKLKFLEKWKEVLEKDHFSPDTSSYLFRERGIEGRILVIDHYVPTPDKDSGSLRIFSIIEILVDLGWKVIFWPDNQAKTEPYVSWLQSMGIEVIYGASSFIDKFREFGPHLNGVWLLRPHIAQNYIDIVKGNSNAFTVYDTVDLHFVREERRAAVEGDERLLEEAKRWKDIELYLANRADAVIVVTPEEKAILEECGIRNLGHQTNQKVLVIPNIHEVVVDEVPFEDRSGLMFIGGFVHPPNIDAMLWFVKEILPKIKSELPEVTLKIVGSNPSKEIKGLANDYIEVTGYVPDVSDFFMKSRVFVSPLRYGAGLKGKIGQSLGYGLPVVTTSIGAEGFLMQGEEPPFLIADDPSDFAEKVLSLYRQKDLWEEMSARGKAFIGRHFTKDVVKSTIKQLLTAMLN